MNPRVCILCDSTGPFREVFSRYGYTLVRCTECGLLFQDPQPSEEQLEASYYHDPAFTEALFGPLRGITESRAADKLPLLESVRELSPGLRALDVGCSSGAWLELLRGRGVTATGVEIGAATAERARERGLDVRTGTLADALPTLSGERFDLITFWDVLEHLPDPRRELELARGLLADDGLLAATFPNERGWYPRTTYRLLARSTGVWEYPELPVHFFDFGPETARRLLRRGGFEPVDVRTTATPFAFYRDTVLSPTALGRGVKGRALRAAFEGLRIPIYPLARLFDRSNALFVAARASG